MWRWKNPLLYNWGVNILLVVAYLNFGIGLLNLSILLKGVGLVRKGLFNGFSSFMLVI